MPAGVFLEVAAAPCFYHPGGFGVFFFAITMTQLRKLGEDKQVISVCGKKRKRYKYSVSHIVSRWR